MCFFSSSQCIYIYSQGRICMIFLIYRIKLWLTLNSFMVTVALVMDSTGVLYLTTLRLDSGDCSTSDAFSDVLRCAFSCSSFCFFVFYIHICLSAWRINIIISGQVARAIPAFCLSGGQQSTLNFSHCYCTHLIRCRKMQMSRIDRW